MESLLWVGKGWGGSLRCQVKVGRYMYTQIASERIGVEVK